ncbi:MAG TPA: tetratricopeptide repeat protein, partial [Anaerolineae bacterium]|nr:tetratricopeptide repeat protein [Anaerolineae bacterium]
RIWSGIGPSRYMFQHALLRDVAYHMQARSLRSKLHLSAAHAISDLHGQDLSAYYDQLAYHYEQAGAVAQALEYLEKAGERAKNAYQNGMAIDHYQRALNLMPEAAPGRLRLLLGLGEVYFWTGDYRGAKETLLAALDAARSGDDARNTADALYWLGRVALATGDYQLAQEHLEQSLALARSEKHRETMTRILYGLGGLHWSLGRFETSKSCLEESLTLARLLGNANAELYALNLLGSVALNQGELETAHEFLTQAHDRARQVGNLERACIALNNLGVLSGNRGDNPSAQRYYQQALAIAREIGDRQTTSLLLVNLAETLILGEDLDSARRYLREGLGLAHQTGVISNMLLAIHNAGWLQVRSGNVRRGLALLGLALYHPAADSKVKRNVDEKLAYLGLKRDDPAVAANLELGKDLDLNPETRDLLAELGQAAR